VDDILCFSSAVKRDPAIDAWLDAQRDDLRPLAETWSARMQQPLFPSARRRVESENS
jgi:hypothetical protein